MKTYHASGNASYVFPGQVMRAGEYIGRIGGMGKPPLPTHLHQEYYRSGSVKPLDTSEIIQTYAPEVNKDGERWVCRGDFCN